MNNTNTTPPKTDKNWIKYSLFQASTIKHGFSLIEVWTAHSDYYDNDYTAFQAVRYDANGNPVDIAYTKTTAYTVCKQLQKYIDDPTLLPSPRVKLYPYKNGFFTLAPAYDDDSGCELDTVPTQPKAPIDKQEQYSRRIVQALDEHHQQPKRPMHAVEDIYESF